MLTHHFKYEAPFVSVVHTKGPMDETLSINDKDFEEIIKNPAEIKSAGFLYGNSLIIIILKYAQGQFI